jgi:hypothetical protein
MFTSSDGSQKRPWKEKGNPASFDPAPDRLADHGIFWRTQLYLNHRIEN